MAVASLLTPLAELGGIWEIPSLPEVREGVRLRQRPQSLFCQQPWATTCQGIKPGIEAPRVWKRSGELGFYPEVPLLCSGNVLAMNCKGCQGFII